MRRRRVVDAHRTTITNARRHRIRHRRPRSKVQIRRIRPRRTTRKHRHEPRPKTPRRRHIQRHRPRIGRNTTTTRHRQHRRHPGARHRRTPGVGQPGRNNRPEPRRRREVPTDIHDHMRRRRVVNTHRTTITNARRHRIRHRRPRSKVQIRRIRPRRTTRKHRHEPRPTTPRRRHIQRHRLRIGRNTTTTRHRQHRRHPGARHRRTPGVGQPGRNNRPERRRRREVPTDIHDHMRRRRVVDAHRTTITNARRHRIRHRRPRSKVQIRRIRPRRTTRKHRHEPRPETPRRRHIQRHRLRIGRNTTTTRHRQHRRHPGIAQAELGVAAVDRRGRIGGRRSGHHGSGQGENEGQTESKQSPGAQGKSRHVESQPFKRIQVGVAPHNDKIRRL